MIRRPNLVIWLQTIAVLGAYTGLVWAVYDGWIAGAVDSVVLGLVLAFGAVQSTVIVGLLVGLTIYKTILGIRERRLSRDVPRVRARLVDWLTDVDQGDVSGARGEIDDLARRLPDAVERCAVELLASISGTELERLGRFLDEAGVVGRWCRGYRTRDAERRRVVVSWLARLPGERGNDVLREALHDSEPSVRIEAARGLLEGERIADIERIFQLALHESLLVRAVLVEDLRPYAIQLAEQAVPRALASSDPRVAVVALEMIEAWQKSLAVPEIVPLLRHPRPEVRARALRVAAYVSSAVEVEREILAGLADASPDVRIAAARVAGRMGLGSAIAPLERLLHSHHPEVAVAAAYGLAELGAAGAAALETAVRANHSTSAGVALEALERVRTDRLRMARV